MSRSLFFLILSVVFGQNQVTRIYLRPCFFCSTDLWLAGIEKLAVPSLPATSAHGNQSQFKSLLANKFIGSHFSQSTAGVSLTCRTSEINLAD